MITEEMLKKAACEVDRYILDTLPDPGECDHEFSETFERKMKKLIRKAKYHVAYKVMKHVACVILALVISFGAFLGINSEARAGFFGWVQDQFQEFYHYFSPSGKQAPEGPGSYTLGWLPEGYTLLDSLGTEFSATSVYVNDSGQMVQFVCVYDVNSTSFSNAMFMGDGEYEQKQVSLGGTPAELYFALSGETTNAITWLEDHGSVCCAIAGFLEEDELVRMAKSVTAIRQNSQK